MRRALHFVFCLTLLASAAQARAGEVIDRIVAVVNRGVVLQSDLDVAVRYQALLEGRSLKTITDQDLKSALDHLIDQQLLFEEMGDPGSFALSDEETKKKVIDVRAQFPEASSDEAWRALLQRYGLTQAIIEERLKTQVEILRFVDLRLRSDVQIDQSEIDNYYHDELLPRLRKAGGDVVPLPQVEGRIKQLLTERRIDELLGVWLHNLREQSHVQVLLESAPGSQAPAAATKGAISERDRQSANKQK
jgi:parvulin-like peptidyl-prolyl isomerase